MSAERLYTFKYSPAQLAELVAADVKKRYGITLDEAGATEVCAVVEGAAGEQTCKDIVVKHTETPDPRDRSGGG